MNTVLYFRSCKEYLDYSFPMNPPPAIYAALSQWTLPPLSVLLHCGNPHCIPWHIWHTFHGSALPWLHHEYRLYSRLLIRFIYLEEYRLNAKVVVDTTMGIWYFLAVNFPQKHTESVTITSGLNSSICSFRKPSILAVILKSTMVISIEDIALEPFSTSSDTSGK